ncbi:MULTISPECIES: hypothetical protein [Staphylococcus]|uniref:Uncharacterized protein n=1 Tax=Staphylococcus warneri TaxID=1292 RepID=A0A2V3ZFL5_STAWA|nr:MULTISPECIES: hypothetical protein [Staphylococcus]ARM68250.1 hypothetical protein [Staphylococcus phage IME1367_01]RRJ53218.1 hypothetical protein EIM20_29930 [Pseudomonas aeruginosa]AGZ26284.1 hypothetical protein STP1_1988 [Staphylococcus pasteuri SP1]KAB7647185.1 hypothetical protein F9280_02935 [Staphylococcus sp. B2-b]KKI61684.1 hypothetical protein UF68_0786 [Staphylococcus warneri]
MANEVVNKKENYILVQVDEKGVETALSIDYRGQFFPSVNTSSAYKVVEKDKADKLASRLNALNELNHEFGIVQELMTIKVAKEIIDINYTEEPQV